MGAKEIRESIRTKYGLTGHKKSKDAYNYAIRAEIPGGAETLDALDHFSKMHRSLLSDRRSHVVNIQQSIDIVAVALDRLHEIAEAMGDEITRRYS